MWSLCELNIKSLDSELWKLHMNTFQLLKRQKARFVCLSQHTWREFISCFIDLLSYRYLHYSLISEEGAFADSPLPIAEKKAKMCHFPILLSGRLVHKMKCRTVTSSHLPQLASATEDPALQTAFSSHHPSKHHPFRSAFQCSADMGLGWRCLLLNPQKYTVPFLAFCHSASSITTTLHRTFYKGFFQALPLSFLPFSARLLERTLSSLCGSSTTCNLASAFILLNWLFLRSPVT